MFPLGLAELCGRAAGQRGATMSYTRILSPAEQILRTNGMFEEEQLLCSPATNPERPFAFEYDFLEIFSGASLVTGVLAAKGIVVGPPLDIGISAEYNLAWEHVMRWVTLLLASKRLNALMVLTFLMSKPTLEMCWVKQELN